MGAGVSDFGIAYNRIGNALGFGVTQKYGVEIVAGASDNYRIIGNDLTGNVTGPLLDGGSGTEKIISGNIPVATTLVLGFDHGDLGGLTDDDHTQYLLVGGSRAMTGTLLMGTNKISGVVDPTSDQEAATKKYVDDNIFPYTLVAEKSATGTAVNFGSIPAGVKQITVMFNGISTNGTDDVIVQLGDAGGIETSGYVCTNARVEAGAANVGGSAAGFLCLINVNAGRSYSGCLILTLQDAGDDTWTGICGFGNYATPVNYNGSGKKSLSDVLTQLSITTSGGTNTFDNGTFSVSYGGQ
jgi:hypothetical protein